MKKYNYYLIILIIIMSCNKYIREIPFKINHDQQDIKNKLGIDVLKPYSINDTINQEYDSLLTDREIYLKEKYSIILGINPKELKNYKFYDFIDNYIKTPYAKKGFSKDSLNMAPFSKALYKYAFNKNVSNSALGIFRSNEIELFIARKYLDEGDIIFFRYSKENPISDIAIYLRNNKILYSTRSKGLGIYNLNDDYFQLRYISSGRLK